MKEKERWTQQAPLYAHFKRLIFFQETYDIPEQMYFKFHLCFTNQITDIAVGLKSV